MAPPTLFIKLWLEKPYFHIFDFSEKKQQVAFHIVKEDFNVGNHILLKL